MRWLDDASLRQKLTFAIMTSSAVALLFASGIFAVQDFVQMRNETSTQLEVLAGIVGHSSASALLFQDMESAEETLRSVLADETVVCAHLFDAEGHAFSAFHRHGKKIHEHPVPVLGREGHHWTVRGLEIVTPIHQGTERVGTVQLYARLDHFWFGLKVNMAIMGLVLLGALCLALLLSSSFQQVISVPIMRLVETMRRVSEQNDFSVRAQMERGAEMRMLVSGFNEMLCEVESRDQALKSHSERLEEEVVQRTAELTHSNEELTEEIAEREKVEAERRVLNEKLMEAARKAGQAEVATGVLHNVGNVLNSVNVSANILEERLRSSRLVGLGKAAELLVSHEADLTRFIAEDPRGRKLPSYLQQLAEKLDGERQESLTQLDRLLKDIEHIKMIVSMQQGYAKNESVLEPLSLPEIVEQAISINANSMERHQVVLTREFADVPDVETDKHKVIQIVVNLLSNSVNSLKQQPEHTRRLTIAIDSASATSARIRVIDNGVGLSTEALARAFQYGYTTRKDGHGFGLHSGAIAAVELGGSLRAASDGSGSGAVFTLELPYRAAPIRRAQAKRASG